MPLYPEKIIPHNAFTKMNTPYFHQSNGYSKFGTNEIRRNTFPKYPQRPFDETRPHNNEQYEPVGFIEHKCCTDSNCENTDPVHVLTLFHTKDNGINGPISKMVTQARDRLSNDLGSLQNFYDLQNENQELQNEIQYLKKEHMNFKKEITEYVLSLLTFYWMGFYLGIFKYGNFYISNFITKLLLREIFIT